MKLSPHESGGLISRYDTEQFLPKEHFPERHLIDHGAMPKHFFGLWYEIGFLLICDGFIKHRAIIATSDPQHKWLTLKHQTPPPILSEYGFWLIANLGKLLMQQFCKRLSVAEWVRFLIFVFADLKKIGAKAKSFVASWNVHA
ncbi:hypothetical protein RF679_06015 [Undibacterium cyanobacteriorum]|uniref:Uncharacterized protein n=1 Tax=Undibacterium cyanobacteriorum TaxID=3073561 RepID=A0ABY9RPB5_9BURK|nr:hypothetical protein [Undibacterium sp. 20NA77.5]WMW81836.1 hypothetical protein RF679_06015 [Undibacterium sp. 20NA77.5]